MFDSLLGSLLLIVFSIVLIIPFGIAGIYFYISLRQLFIGATEKVPYKVRGGIIPLVISSIVLGATLYGWLWMWVL